MKPASSRQFGGGLDDAGNNHRDDEVALAAGNRVEDGIQLQSAQATENRGDMTVRQGSGDEEGIRQRRGGSGQGAVQSRAEGCNLLSGEMGDIGEGASLDFAILAIGFTEEDGWRRVAVGYGGDIHAYIIQVIKPDYKYNYAILHAYTIDSKSGHSHQNKENSLRTGQNFGLEIHN